MPVKDTRPIKTVNNVDMMNALRRDASLEYQARVPEATRANVEASIEALTNYQPAFNEFVSALVNRIGLVIAKNMIWENPLKVFKRGMLTYGDTIEEIYTGLLEARVYDPDRENMEKILFGTELPPVETNFHRVNRQDFYKFTVNEDLLRRAFLSEDGLQQFVNTLMSAPVTSDNWDEFLITCSLFKTYEDAGGFWHVNVPDNNSFDSDGADARLFLRKVRAMAETLTFPSTSYNAAKMPTFAKPDEMVLITTPNAKAAMDVEALAAAFNIDRMRINERIITVPEAQIGIPGAQAILTTDDFFMIADQKIATTSMINPASLHTNYFLHHWEVISASRFAPAVVFWTGADDEVINIVWETAAITDIVLTDVNGETVTDVTRGYLAQATASATGIPDGYELGVIWDIDGQKSLRTRISQTGVLYIAPDEPSDSIVITAMAQVPDEVGAILTKNSTVTVVGNKFPDWPVGSGAGEDEG